MNRFRLLPVILFSTSALPGLLLMTGCETRPSRSLSDAATVPRPIAMSGEAHFFDGKITASVTVSRGSGRPGGTGNAEEGRGGGKRGGGRQRGGPPPGGAGGSDPDSTYAQPVHRSSSLPTVTLRLKLENHTNAPVEVEISEVSSDLGNFAVRPEKLTLAPNESAEPDPMFSQLGVTSDEIPVKVGLKNAGITETEVLAVKTVRTAVAPTLAP